MRNPVHAGVSFCTNKLHITCVHKYEPAFWLLMAELSVDRVCCLHAGENRVPTAGHKTAGQTLFEYPGAMERGQWNNSQSHKGG